jgi:hypothetical protein
MLTVIMNTSFSDMELSGTVLLFITQRTASLLFLFSACEYVKKLTFVLNVVQQSVAHKSGQDGILSTTFVVSYMFESPFLLCYRANSWKGL